MAIHKVQTCSYPTPHQLAIGKYFATVILISVLTAVGHHKIQLGLSPFGATSTISEIFHQILST